MVVFVQLMWNIRSLYLVTLTFKDIKRKYTLNIEDLFQYHYDLLIIEEYEISYVSVKAFNFICHS
jgi:hypothetical protein